MLISCPYCGPRDVGEFTYQGDGNRVRPDPASTDLDAWNDYVFDRVNIAGDHNEIWQHSGGCRSHLVVVRNTLTHKVSSVRMVRDGSQQSRFGRSFQPRRLLWKTKRERRKIRRQTKARTATASRGLRRRSRSPSRRAKAGRRRKPRRREMSARRTTSGGRIDRNKTVHFSFDGQQYSGHPGDTLASALLANGVTLFGRSFKYHRPRGLLSAGVDEPNALVTVLRGNVREPNVPGNPDRDPRRACRRSARTAIPRWLSTSAQSTSSAASCSAPASTTRPSWGR